MALGLQDEIRRSEESRYDHRLHGVLLVAQGMSCPDVAGLLGDAPRSVENWVSRFERSGLAGLREGEQSGRPQRLNSGQVAKINAILRQTPREVGLSQNLWDGKALSAWIEREYGVSLAGCGKTKLNPWRIKHDRVELFYAWSRSSAVGDVQLPVA